MLNRRCSLFLGARATKVTDNLTFEQVFKTIQGSTSGGKAIRKSQKEYRENPDQGKKERQPAILAGAVVDSRDGRLTWQERNPIPSGVLIADLDGHHNPEKDVLTFKAIAKLCPWAFGACTSYGGEGVKVMIAIERTTDPIAYRVLKAAVVRWFEMHDIVVCGSTSVRGLSFLSYDPELWVREGDPEELKIDQEAVDKFKASLKAPTEIRADIANVLHKLTIFSENLRAAGVILHHPEARDLSWAVHSAVGDDALWILETLFDDLVSHPDHFEKHLATDRAQESADPVTYSGLDLIIDRAAENAGVATLVFGDLPDPGPPPAEDPGDDLGDPNEEAEPAPVFADLPEPEPKAKPEKAKAPQMFADIEPGEDPPPPPEPKSAGDDEEDPDKPPVPRLRTFTEAKQEPSPKLEVLIDGLLRHGARMSIAAPSKAGKTWTLLQFGLCMASNQAWLGFRPARKLKVLFLDFELGESLFEERMFQVADALRISPADNPTFAFKSLRDNTTPLQSLLKHIKKWSKGFDLIVIDPIYTLIARGGADENDNTEVTRILMTIGAYVKALVYSQHFSKGAQAGKSAIDRPSGAGAFARWPDAIITLTEHEDPDHYVFESALRAFRPVEPFVIERTHPLMLVRPDSCPDALRGNQPRRSFVQPASVLSLIRDSEDPVPRAEIKRLLEEGGANVTVRAIGDALKELRDTDQVTYVRGAGGGYTLAAPDEG